MSNDNKFPRRNMVSEMKPAEIAIRNAILEVEKMPADVDLTNAVDLLSQALNKVSDYIDK